MPNRLLSYEKIVKGKSSDKRKRSFQFGYAESHLIIYYKESESRKRKSKLA